MDHIKYGWPVFAAFTSVAGLISGITIAFSINEAKLSSIQAEYKAQMYVIEGDLERLERHHDDVVEKIDGYVNSVNTQNRLVQREINEIRRGLECLQDKSKKCDF